MNKLGMIADVQRCSIHDGPGIRTSIFLKGCNMDCAWCHNPETIDFKPEYLVDMDKCIGCNMCDDGCFSGARILCGREMMVDDLLAEIMLDRPYYGEDGGVTITGGEPLCQLDFVYELLKRCREIGIHTTIESNMFVDFNRALKVFKLCDLVMCDMKIFDDALHKKYTKVSNRVIKENLLKLDALNIPIIIRTPIIPSINDTIKNIEDTSKFVSTINNLLYYELLPYHPLGLSKGVVKLKKEYETPGKDRMIALGKAANENCINVIIAGKKLEEFAGGSDA